MPYVNSSFRCCTYVVKYQHKVPRDSLQVRGTNDSSTLSKCSMMQHGYFPDNYLKYFAAKSVRRAPLIHRGYYIRYKMLFCIQFTPLVVTEQEWLIGSCNYSYNISVTSPLRWFPQGLVMIPVVFVYYQKVPMASLSRWIILKQLLVNVQ